MNFRIDRKLLLIIVIAFLTTLSSYLISPIEVRYLQNLTDSSVLLGVVYASGSVFFSLLSIWIGRKSDRKGRGKYILLGSGLGIIYPIFYATVLNVYQYIGIKFFWAFTAVTTGPVFLAFIQDYLKDKKDKAHKMGLIYSVQSISGAIAMQIGGSVSERYGLRAPYFLMSFVFLVTTVVLYKLISESNLDVKARKGASDLLFGIKYVFSKDVLRFYFIINTVYTLNYGIKYMLYPLIIYDLVRSNALIGSIMSTQGIVAFFVLLVAGKIQNKIGVYKTAFITLLILGLSGGVMGITSNINIFWIFVGLYAVAEAMYGPVQAVLLIDNVDSEYRGEILGIDSTFDTILTTIAPLGAGLLLDQIGAQKILLLYTSFAWLVLVGGYMLYKKKLATQIS